MSPPDPRMTAMLVRLLWIGGALLSVAGIVALGSGTAPLLGGAVLAAGVADLILALTISKRS